MPIVKRLRRPCSGLCGKMFVPTTKFQRVCYKCTERSIRLRIVRSSLNGN